MAASTDISATTPPPPTAEVLPRDGGSHLRGDIEGLRAIAVGLVFADHLLGWPRGGFIGVDVFFVISGFLITGLLLREHQRTGRISFADFYRRRARRILPASLLVLAVTAFAVRAVFFGSRAHDVAVDAVWALLFSGNWHFALVGTDYLQAGGPVSPLQHYWSLSVEEQFYFVWPLLLLGLLGLGGRRRGRLVAGLGLVAVVVASAAWALTETANDPTFAYFSTFSRAWELGVGALLAIGAGRLRSLPGTARTVLAWLGLIGIVTSAFVVSAQVAFPAPWAAAPVLGTALVIGAGTGAQPRLLWPLTNPVSRYLGGLSYSLYLWHFPVIIVAGSLFESDPATLVSTAAVAFLLAALSFHLVEQPIRHSDWLRPGARGRPYRRPTCSWHGALVPAAMLVLVASVAIVPVTGSEATASTPALPPVPVAAAPRAPALPTLAETEQTLTAALSTALDADAWPADLDPALDALGDLSQPTEWRIDDCLRIDDAADAARCRYGPADAPKTAVLVGDSVAISWLTGLRAALVPQGYSIQVLTFGQCPAVEIPVYLDGMEGADFPDCDQHHAFVRSELERLHPDLIIMSSALNTLFRLSSGSEGAEAQEEWQDATAETLAAFDGLGSRIVLLQAPPIASSIEECATRLGTPADCVFHPGEMDPIAQAAEEAAVAQYPGATPVRYVHTAGWFCLDDRCPPFVGNHPMFTDITHLTPTYSQRLGDVLGPAILGP